MAEEIDVNNNTEVEPVAEAPVVPPQPIVSTLPIESLPPTELVEPTIEKPSTIDQNTPEQIIEIKTIDQNIPEQVTAIPETVAEEKPVQVTEEKKPEVVELPKKDEEAFSPRKYLLGLLVKANEAVQIKKRKNLDKLIEYFNTKERVKNNDVEKLLDVKDAAATNYLNRLVKDNKIERHGTGSGTWYSKTLK
ncbi:hypothetical protein IT400_01870 [Candidatus Nomurabacteria bacterium]|nr:hypothetical protein [Candidatus Nomurabacteria bacterium]